MSRKTLSAALFLLLALLCTPLSALPPQVQDDQFVVDEDTTLTVSAPGVVDNDVDPDGDSVLVHSHDPQTAFGVPVTVLPDGSFEYTPPNHVSGAVDSFTYIASDYVPVGIGEFSPHAQLPAIGNAGTYDAAVGDLNGDAIPDLVTGNATAGSLGVWQNEGDGKFVGVASGLSVGSVTDIDLVDFNGDGDLDIFVSDQTSVLKLWENDGQASFSANTTVFAAFTFIEVNSMAFGDIDGDGDADAFVSDNTYHHILINDGAGGFTPHPAVPRLGFSGRLYHPYFVDLDGDTDLDLVVGGWGKITYYTNDGAGALTLLADQAASGIDAGDLALGDIDEDGDNDMIVGSGSGVEIFVNGGAGLMSPHPTNPTVGTGSMWDVALADVDLDGDLDIIAARYSGATGVYVWLNQGGSFTPHPTTPKPSNGVVHELVLGDWDADRDLDLFLATRDGQDQVLMNQTDRVPLSSPVSVTISINPVNDVPVAAADRYETQEDGTLTVTTPGLLLNDYDFDEDDTLTVSSAPTTSDQGGTIAWQPDGGFVFVPKADFFGVDSFTYVATDATVDSQPATVTIVVTPDNDPPTALADTATTDEEVAVEIDVLANDSDPDGELLDIQSVSAPANGTASITARRTVLYQGALDFSGPDVFDYIVVDAAGTTSTASVVVTVLPLNDAPAFVAPTPEGTVSGTEGQAMTFAAVALDPEDDTITYGAESLPAGATIDPVTGAFTWTPTWEQAGTTAITLTASDSVMESRRELTLDVTGLDADLDGLPDGWEATIGLATDSADSDGDSISDFDEVGDITAPSDVDNDGTIDALDLDSDADGVLDQEEAGDSSISTDPADHDGDGTPDFQDTDSDDDGVQDGVDNCRFVANESQDDLDGDRMGDACDEDADTDGLQDILEPGLGLSPRVADSDGDTIRDGDEVGDPADPANTDGDADIDALDADSDGDGIDDVDEAGDAVLATPPVDTDGDGTPDFQDTDSDDDGVDDGEDNCRLVANADQADTNQNDVGDLCEGDADGDSIADNLDNCPLIANTEQTDLDGDSEGDACDGDLDGDNVDNTIDLCPEDPDAELQVDSDGDGVGDACDGDLDGDGVLNALDNCPLAANADQNDEDGDGIGDVCQPPAPELPVEDVAPSDDGCGCRVAVPARSTGSGSLWLFLGLAAVVLRRRLRR